MDRIVANVGNVENVKKTIVFQSFWGIRGIIWINLEAMLCHVSASGLQVGLSCVILALSCDMFTPSWPTNGQDSDQERQKCQHGPSRFGGKVGTGWVPSAAPNQTIWSEGGYRLGAERVPCQSAMSEELMSLPD